MVRATGVRNTPKFLLIPLPHGSPCALAFKVVCCLCAEVLDTLAT